MSERFFLLRFLRRTTSHVRILWYSKDNTQKKRALGYLFFKLFVPVLMLPIGFVAAVTVVKKGLGAFIPCLMVLIVIFTSFVFALMRATSYMFRDNGFGMLFSFPIRVKSLFAAGFLYMYMAYEPSVLCLSVSVLAGVTYCCGFSLSLTAVFVVLAVVLPFLPMAFGTVASYLIAWVSVHTAHKKIIQSIITAAAVAVILFLYPFFGLKRAITAVSCALTSPLMLIIFMIMGSVLFMELFFDICSRRYSRLCTELEAVCSGMERRPYGRDYRPRSVVWSITKKEFRRMLYSPTYALNAGIGCVIALLIAFASLFCPISDWLRLAGESSNTDPSLIATAVPFLLYATSGMLSTSACSPSLEGKCDWIIESMPVKPFEDCLGKMLFQLMLIGPVMMVSILLVDISAGVEWWELLLSELLGLLLSLFSAVYGMYCGLTLKCTDYTSEIEVVKQGGAVWMYLFLNLALTIGSTLTMLFLGMRIGVPAVYIIMISFWFLLFILFLGLLIKKLQKKQYRQIKEYNFLYLGGY